MTTFYQSGLLYSEVTITGITDALTCSDVRKRVTPTSSVVRPSDSRVPCHKKPMCQSSEFRYRYRRLLLLRARPQDWDFRGPKCGAEDNDACTSSVLHTENRADLPVRLAGGKGLLQRLLVSVNGLRLSKPEVKQLYNHQLSTGSRILSRRPHFRKGIFTFSLTESNLRPTVPHTKTQC